MPKLEEVTGFFSMDQNFVLFSLPKLNPYKVQNHRLRFRSFSMQQYFARNI